MASSLKINELYSMYPKNHHIAKGLTEITSERPFNILYTAKRLGKLNAF